LNVALDKYDLQVGKFTSAADKRKSTVKKSKVRMEAEFNALSPFKEQTI
jgi:hypothetical protein